MGKAREYIVKATKPFPLYLYRKLIKNPRDAPSEKYTWFQGINILRTDDKLEEWYGNHGMGYLAAFYFQNVDVLELNGNYNPLDEMLKDTTNASMSNKYITTNVDIQFNNIKDAIKNKTHVQNECWINTAIDVWGDNLLSQNKRQPITREKILEIINKTDDINNLEAMAPHIAKYYLLIFHICSEF